jgi:hypothetical protein
MSFTLKLNQLACINLSFLYNLYQILQKADKIYLTINLLICYIIMIFRAICEGWLFNRNLEYGARQP